MPGRLTNDRGRRTRRVSVSVLHTPRPHCPSALPSPPSQRDRGSGLNVESSEKTKFTSTVPNPGLVEGSRRRPADRVWEPMVPGSPLMGSYLEAPNCEKDTFLVTVWSDPPKN